MIKEDELGNEGARIALENLFEKVIADGQELLAYHYLATGSLIKRTIKKLIILTGKNDVPLNSSTQDIVIDYLV